MRKYYLAAVIPLIVAVACVCVAWRILNQKKHLPVPFTSSPRAPIRTSSSSPPPSPPFVLPVATTHKHSNITLPSECLVLPSHDRRETLPTTPCKDLERGTRVWKLNFDSSCKDGATWPTTSQWRMELSTYVRNVTSTTLRSVGLDMAEYTVDAWNNMIDVNTGGVDYAVSVELGMYASGGDLATAITAAFVTHAALANLTAVYTPLTDTITISESTPTEFTLLWGSGANVNSSLWKTLGFVQQDVTSVLSGGAQVVISPGRIDLYGVLAVDVFADELTNSLEGPIGRVLLKQTVDGAPVFQETIVNDYHTFWPISKIQFLTFRFMVQYGHINEDGSMVCKYRPYEFHGRHNTIQLDFGVTSYVNPLEAEVQLEPVS